MESDTGKSTVTPPPARRERGSGHRGPVGALVEERRERAPRTRVRAQGAVGALVKERRERAIHE